ncbi:MAG: hypothetical protein HETSPECPRED_006451 [Heterodermia speciosa]|uniref:Uncharacterized protein n=1 Tax=Heterodermia speciosa TaxID=116794 RepID=A0A8H3FKT5_9LECA|nr:MAG: hypothetical protein HETSPECPRED_006451 [Heterodermia speciosa]
MSVPVEDGPQGISSSNQATPQLDSLVSASHSLSEGSQAETSKSEDEISGLGAVDLGESTMDISSEGAGISDFPSTEPAHEAAPPILHHRYRNHRPRELSRLPNHLTT